MPLVFKLHVDIGNLKFVGKIGGKEQRFCLVCGSDTAEDEDHFVFDCPAAAYCAIRDRPTAVFWGARPATACLLSVFTLMTPGSLPTSCVNVSNIGLCCWMVHERGRSTTVTEWPPLPPAFDEHECTKDSLISCLFACLFFICLQYWLSSVLVSSTVLVSAQTIGQLVMVGPTNECMNE